MSLSYIYYGKGGYKGVFSGKYTLDWVRITSFPRVKDFEILSIDRFAFNVTGIWTAFPSSPVNFYGGIGVGFSVLFGNGWTLEEEKDAAGNPTGRMIRKDKVSYPIPLPPLHIPVGINIRIKKLLINVEAGLRDVVPYVTGGIGFIFGKAEDVKIVKETVQVPSPQVTGKLSGRVVDKNTNEPIGRAVIEMRGTGLTDLSTHPRDGSFVTPDLTAGKVQLVASKDGYAATTTTALVTTGTTMTLTILLQKMTAIGAVSGRVEDLQGTPLSAPLSILPAGTEKRAGHPPTAPVVSDASTGEFFVKLVPGEYTITATLPTYKSQTYTVMVKEGIKTRIQFVMHPLTGPIETMPPPPVAEKKPKVFIEKQKIVITETIHFGLGKANVLPVSFSLLDDVAGVLSQHPGISIRIEGHTDNIGKDETNRRLSQARADAVMKYLITKGVDPVRLTAAGYGAARPIADNSTPDGRARNRRVEFVIIKQ